MSRAQLHWQCGLACNALPRLGRQRNTAEPIEARPIPLWGDEGHSDKECRLDGLASVDTSATMKH